MPLIILSLRSQQDMYGYQLVQEIARQSQGKFLTKEGSLYPVLYKLSEEECITSYEIQSRVRMRRYYLTLMTKDREYLRILKDRYDTRTDGLQLILKKLQTCYICASCSRSSSINLASGWPGTRLPSLSSAMTSVVSGIST